MQLHTFIAAAIHKGARTTSHPGLFTSIRKEGCMDLRVSVDVVVEKVRFDLAARRTPVT
jgi:hypothetical protein